MKRNIFLAGKNDIACNALSYLLNKMHYPIDHIKAIPTDGDTGQHTWQRSFRLTAAESQVECISLSECYKDESALFLSLEYDKIVHVERFASNSLFNIHFSKLPSYRGVGMAVWPLLNGEKESGVTLHRIDNGIDTGDLVAQRAFTLPLDWTSRDLYQAFLDEAYILFRDWIERLIDGRIVAKAQSAVGATYYSKNTLDYSNLVIDFNRTAYQIHNQIRAFIFPEYQLPVIFGKKVRKSQITRRRSTAKPGSIEVIDPFSAFVSTVDYDVQVFFDSSS